MRTCRKDPLVLTNNSPYHFCGGGFKLKERNLEIKESFHVELLVTLNAKTRHNVGGPIQQQHCTFN